MHVMSQWLSYIETTGNKLCLTKRFRSIANIYSFKCHRYCDYTISIILICNHGAFIAKQVNLSTTQSVNSLSLKYPN